MPKNLRTKDMAELLGVTPQTIRKYADQGTIPHHTTPAGQLLFTQEDIQEILGTPVHQEEKIWAHYTRSSSGDTKALQEQYAKLEEYYGTPAYKISDKASGLNENRKGLAKLISLAQEKKITDIALTRQDRLTRFGYKYLEALFAQNNVRIHYLHEKLDTTIQDEMMSDFMSIIASFSGRYSQLKSREAKKALLEKALDKVDQ